MEQVYKPKIDLFKIYHNKFKGALIIAGFYGIGKKVAEHKIHYRYKHIDQKDYMYKDDKLRSDLGISEYIKAIKNKVNNYDIIAVSYSKELVNTLYQEGYNVIVVHPNRFSKVDYIDGYIKIKGYSGIINSLFASWDKYIDEIYNDIPYDVIKYELKERQFIYDIFGE